MQAITEDEAKTKECPKHLPIMIATQISAAMMGGSKEVIEAAEEIGFCTASDCMWWQWRVKPMKDSVFPEKETTGYCGACK